MIVGIEEGHEHLSQVNPSRRLEQGDILWVVGEEADSYVSGLFLHDSMLNKVETRQPIIKNFFMAVIFE